MRHPTGKKTTKIRLVVFEDSFDNIASYKTVESMIEDNKIPSLFNQVKYRLLPNKTLIKIQKIKFKEFLDLSLKFYDENIKLEEERTIF